jgi:hypothetical protein
MGIAGPAGPVKTPTISSYSINQSGEVRETAKCFFLVTSKPGFHQSRLMIAGNRLSRARIRIHRVLGGTLRGLVGFGRSWRSGGEPILGEKPEAASHRAKNNDPASA